MQGFLEDNLYLTVYPRDYLITVVLPTLSTHLSQSLLETQNMTHPVILWEPAGLFFLLKYGPIMYLTALQLTEIHLLLPPSMGIKGVHYLAKPTVLMNKISL